MTCAPVSRRTFLQSAAGVTLASIAPRAFAAGSDTLRVATVGAGDRGTYDAE